MQLSRHARFMRLGEREPGDRHIRGHGKWLSKRQFGAYGDIVLRPNESGASRGYAREMNAEAERPPGAH